MGLGRVGILRAFSAKLPWERILHGSEKTRKGVDLAREQG